MQRGPLPRAIDMRHPIAGDGCVNLIGEEFKPRRRSGFIPHSDGAGLIRAERIRQYHKQHVVISLKRLRILPFHHARDFESARIQFEGGNSSVRQAVKPDSDFSVQTLFHQVRLETHVVVLRCVHARRRPCA
jgi:hypothetical protein